MTFKITISRQPFAVEFETGSVSEAIGVFQAEESEFAKLFDLKFGAPSEGEAEGASEGTSPALATGTVQTGETAPTKRGRGPRTKDRVEAPAPIAIPEAPPTAPVAPIDDGIPEALRRAPAMAPPPPSAPAAPPAPPAPPPSGVLAGKIAAHMDAKLVTHPEGAQAWADWLAVCGITIKGATYAEAVDVLRLQGDEKLGPIAAQLGVA